MNRFACLDLDELLKLHKSIYLILINYPIE